MAQALTHSEPHFGDRPRPGKELPERDHGHLELDVDGRSQAHRRHVSGRASASAFFVGGMFALLVRLTLLTPSHKLFGKVLIDAETYNRVFTLHGAIMVFLFIIPVDSRRRSPTSSCR